MGNDLLQKDNIITINDMPPMPEKEAELSMRDRIAEIENQIKSHEQCKCPLVHYFTDGIYARVIIMPKGAYITGKVHKHEHLNVVLSGSVSIVCGTVHGEMHYKTGDVFISRPNTKKLLYIHEDTMFMTIHATDKRIPEEIEEEVTSISYDVEDHTGMA